ncbi:hypothetical protein D3C81_1840730 [compost metagenome]
MQLLGDEMGPGHQRPPAALPVLALPEHPQVALDGERATQLGGYPFVQRGLDAVPVECGDQYQQGCHQQHQRQYRPGQDAKTSRHALLPVSHRCLRQRGVMSIPYRPEKAPGYSDSSQGNAWAWSQNSR